MADGILWWASGLVDRCPKFEYIYLYFKLDNSEIKASFWDVKANAKEHDEIIGHKFNQPAGNMEAHFEEDAYQTVGQRWFNNCDGNLIIRVHFDLW